jgi:ubiquinone/menaquinone biosynthesis C-methylase UbiE
MLLLLLKYFFFILCLLIIYATTLHDMRQVDLGCGSGSLLEALLKEPNTLEHMIGIDISRKALIRGAKVYIHPVYESLAFTFNIVH